jgi:hypothetical protein
MLADSNVEGSFLQDTFSSAKELITERFSSPLIFSFVISWSVINFKAIVITFTKVSGDFKIKDKLELISNIIGSSTFLTLPHQWLIVLNGFVLPLSIALIYVFIYPFIDLKITRFTLNRKKDLWNARVDAEEGIKYSAKDVKKLRKGYEEDQLDTNRQLNHLEATINLLRQENEVLKNQLETNEKVNASKEALLDKLEHENKGFVVDSDAFDIERTEQMIIKILGDANDNNVEWVEEKKLLRTKNLTPTDVKIALDSLMSNKLVQRRFVNEFNDYCYQLEISGLKVYKNLEATGS